MAKTFFYAQFYQDTHFKSNKQFFLYLFFFDVIMERSNETQKSLYTFQGFYHIYIYLTNIIHNNGSDVNQIVIHSAALENNFKFIQKTVGSSVPVMAMVKADAYGHGSVKAAEAFARVGCRRFGVAELREEVEVC